MQPDTRNTDLMRPWSINDEDKNLTQRISHTVFEVDKRAKNDNLQEFKNQDSIEQNSLFDLHTERNMV